MPKLPWKSVNQIDPRAECTVMASRLPLRRHWDIPGFLRLTMRIRGQLAGTDGLVGYALDAELFAKTFWTVSAWSDRDHLERFAGTDPHRTGTEAIHPKMLESTFVFWTATAADLPVDWADAKRRIDAARAGG
jgi:hypothetical protein